MTIENTPIWDKIKEKISIPDLIDLENNRCECLVDGNTSSPSCQYYEDTELLYCHKCDKTMDVIEVYTLINNIDRKTAIKDLAREYKIPFEKKDEKEIELEVNIQNIIQDFMEKCHNNPNFKKKYFLLEMEKRGFTKETIESFRIGLVDNSVKEYMVKTYSKDLLRKAGFYNSKTGNWSFINRIVYPYLDHKENPKYFIYRVIPYHSNAKELEKKFKYLKQNTTEYVKEIPLGLNSLKENKDKPLIITEGITDAISVIQAKFPCLSPVTTKIKKTDIEKMVSYCKRFKKVVVINDNEINNQGLKGAITTLEVLLKNEINVYIGIIPNPNNLDKIDLDDYLKPNLSNIENKDQYLNKKIKDSIKEQNQKLLELVESAIEGFDFLLKQIDPDKPNEKQVRGLLEMIPEGDIAIKSVYLTKLKKHTKLSIKDLENIQAKAIREEREREKEIINEEFVIDDNHKEDIDDFLNSENKFQMIQDVLDYAIVNENKNKVLVFLLLSGAYTNKYQIIIAIGDSTGGKSHIVENVVDIFPVDHTFTLTGASDKALIYKEWKNEKIIHIPECQRNPQILENLKDFGDRGIFYYYVDRNAENEFETFEKVIGVKSVVLTTTIDGLNPQLENRAWKLEPDLSVDQSRAIVDRSIRLKEDMINFLKLEKEQREKELSLNLTIKTLEKEFNFDNTEISYLIQIKNILIDTFIKIRRDHKKFFDLIEIIANWNYRIREYYEFDKKRILLSHPNDLMNALDIGEEIFMHLIRNLTPVKTKILKCVEHLEEEEEGKEQKKEDKYFPQKNSKKEDKYFKTGVIYGYFVKQENYRKSKKSFRNLLNTLNEAGYLDKSKKGKENAYRLREGNTIKLLDAEKKKEIYLKANELYNQRIEILKSMDNIKVYEKNIKPLDLDELELYSKELYYRILEIFKDNNTNNLNLDNLIQTLSIDYEDIDQGKEIYNMVKLGLFKKNFDNELILEN